MRTRDPLIKLVFFWAAIQSVSLPRDSMMAQQVAWPTDASRLMTSSFGEFRPGHFHAGIDVKTWGQEGYRVFAVEDGSIINVRVSPYGYGKVIYHQLDDGHTVVYAHLSNFAPFLDRIVQSEQIRRKRYAIQKTFKPRMITVGKGELIGFTGSSGSGVPHLHFEVRDSLGWPLNPLSFNYDLEDLTPPTLEAVGISPLSFGSQVDGDFIPKVFSLRRLRRDRYILDRVVKVWGKLGISLSAYDQTDGAWNRFAPFRIRLTIDDKPHFCVTYDRFSYEHTRQVDLDRDYRLRIWGKGLFQNLYREEGNTLSFYDPDVQNAGILFTENVKGNSVYAEPDLLLGSEDTENLFAPGDHVFRIEVFDYYGNCSEARGVLRLMPMETSWPFEEVGSMNGGNGTTVSEKKSDVEMNKHFFEEFIHYRVIDPENSGAIPNLFVELNSWERTSIPLFPQSHEQFVGVYPVERGSEGLLTSELRYFTREGTESVVRDTVQIFEITPEKGGVIYSPDGRSRVVFSRGSSYTRFAGFCRIERVNLPNGVEKWQYRFFPNDIPLKKSARVYIDTRETVGMKNKLGIYTVNGEGRSSFVGNGWKGGDLTAWIGNLGAYTVLQDTVPPLLTFIEPQPEAIITDTKPRIVIGFEDTLSGLYGERNYSVMLDGKPLIVEYVPSKDVGVCRVDESLIPGPHVLEVSIRDRAGNVIRRRNHFTVTSR